MESLEWRKAGGNGEETLRVAPIYAERGRYCVVKMNLVDRERWREIWRGLTERQEVVWRGPFLEGERVLVLFQGGRGEEEVVLPLQGELGRGEGGEELLRIGSPGLSWRMGAIELGRALEERGGAEGKERGAPEAAMLRSAVQAGAYQVRRIGLRSRIWGGASNLAVDPALKAVVTGLRAEYLKWEEILSLTSLSRGRLLSFLNALRVGGLLREAPRVGMGSGDPYEYFGLHWSAHEHQIRSRYRELKSIPGGLEGGKEGGDPKKIETTFEQLHRPDWRRQYRRKHYPAPIVAEVGDYYRRKITRLRGREERDLEEMIDACRRLLELDGDDRDVRALLVTLLSRAERRRRRNVIP